MQLDLNGLFDQSVHVSAFGGQDLGVLELDTMSPADIMFSYGRFFWMSPTNVPVMQTGGAAMGSSLSPVIANYFMEYFEEMALETAIHKPLCWFRYVDKFVV
jgi:hypothetical protein